MGGDKTYFKLPSAGRTRKYRLIAMRTELRNCHTRTQFEATSSILLRGRGPNAMLRILSKVLLAGAVVSEASPAKMADKANRTGCATNVTEQ